MGEICDISEKQRKHSLLLILALAAICDMVMDRESGKQDRKAVLRWILQKQSVLSSVSMEPRSGIIIIWKRMHMN